MTGQILTPADLVARVAAAQALGVAIGIERQFRHRLAGLVTNALVSTGAGLFTILGAIAGEHDPIRVVPYVVTGIGFLCGGVILREGLTVRGLNTAATLWCAASVGCAAGAGFFWEASAGAAAIIFANVAWVPVGDMIDRRPGQRPRTRYACSITCRSRDQEQMRALFVSEINDTPFALTALHSEHADEAGEVRVLAELSANGRNDPQLERLVSRMSLESGVRAVRWELVPENPD